MFDTDQKPGLLSRNRETSYYNPFYLHCTHFMAMDPKGNQNVHNLPQGCESFGGQDWEFRGCPGFADIGFRGEGWQELLDLGVKRGQVYILRYMGVVEFWNALA